LRLGDKGQRRGKLARKPGFAADGREKKVEGVSVERS